MTITRKLPITVQEKASDGNQGRADALDDPGTECLGCDVQPIMICKDYSTCGDIFDDHIVKRNNCKRPAENIPYENCQGATIHTNDYSNDKVIKSKWYLLVIIGLIPKFEWLV